MKTLNIAPATDNKKFRKSVKSLFSNKVKTKDNLKFIEVGITSTKSSPSEVFSGKAVLKMQQIAANLQENTHAEVQFQ